jgi:hypothetical protein
MYELETCSKRDPFSAVNALAHAVINGEDPLAKARAQSLLDDLPRTAHGGESLDAVALRELLEL